MDECCTMIPRDGLGRFQSTKQVHAGEITEVVVAGCYVKEDNGDSVLRLFQPHMTARYEPKVGDFWIVYDDGYESLSPRDAFLSGYIKLAS